MTQPDYDIPKASLLAVDDTPENLRLLVDLLRGRGYTVRGAINGDLALEAATQQIPDLILLDILMPGMDGYEVCRRLKENPQTQDIPVIFISAMDTPLDKVKAFAIGGVDYVQKPFNGEEVSARVATHLELHKLQQGLQQQVELRTAALTEANAALEKALQVKCDFLSMMNHEFRTPLNGVLGATSLLANNHDEEIRGLAQVIRESGWCLMRLVENLLQAARQGRAIRDNTDLHVTPPVDISEFCSDSLATIAAAARKKGLNVHPSTGRPPPLRLPLDPSRLRQIVGNLLDNAVKFTPPGEVIGLETGFEPEGRRLTLDVWDSGPGIPEADRERVFEAFVQLEPFLTRSHGGSGLGLTLARNLARLHGGTVDILGDQSGGTRVRLTLPAEPAEEASGEQVESIGGVGDRVPS